MNIDEFNLLVERAANLTTLPNWLAGKNKIETLAVWYGLIQRVEINAAIRVLDGIVAGEIDLPRDSWSGFPKAILRETKPQSKDKTHTTSDAPTNRVRCRRCERRFRIAPLARHCPDCGSDDWAPECQCRDCGDLQVVLVWSPAAIDDARRLIVADMTVDLRPAKKYVCGVPCHCSAPGERRQYDPARMIPIEPEITAIARLVEHVETLLYGRAGRRDDFVAWNAGGAANA